MVNLQAEPFSERSPLYRKHAGAQLRQLGETTVVACYSGNDERAQRQRCGNAAA